MFRFAAQNLLSRPVRSMLALLGLTVAIMGMVGLFSIAVGIDDTVNKSFSRIPGLAAMQPGAPIPIFSRIPMEWAKEMAAMKGIRVVRPEVWARAQLVEGKPTFSPPRLLFGLDIERTIALRKAVYRDDIKEGRFLLPEDRGTFNCLISRQIADSTHKQVGDQLRVDNFNLTVVGIYECGSLILDVSIVLDGDAVRRIAKLDGKFVNSIYFEPDDSMPEKELIKSVQDKFRGRETGNATDGFGGGDLLTAAAAAMLKQAAPEKSADAKPGTEDPLEIRSASDWGEKVQELSGDLDIFLWLMTGIGVVIALLSILNTMLMSVAERIIEFGVLKANGWSSWDILKLITWESALLGVVGGVCGCTLGWAAAQFMNWLLPDRLHLYASPGLLLFSLGFSTVLGMVGGLYPAWWAVRMSPMEAIRRG